jgi:hypothetical protein
MLLSLVLVLLLVMLLLVVLPDGWVCFNKLSGFLQMQFARIFWIYLSKIRIFIKFLSNEPIGPDIKYIKKSQ